MATWRSIVLLVIGAMLLFTPAISAQQSGSIRGLVFDGDFDAPLGGAQVLIVELDATVESSDQGNYVFGDLAPGTYTLVFSKSGYVRQVRANVVVAAGRLTDVDATLAGDFEDMEEFVVQDVLAMGAGSEAALMQLRFDSPALMDSISSDLMNQAGASDAASALRLVSGASTQDGKFAVIRGLPDRYVSSQLNGVRLPSADEDTRSVELDQFPSTVIDSIQVSKTFTPDQQGDASGGAVDVRLKGVPDVNSVQFKAQSSYNTNVTGRSDFLSYAGGGVSRWGKDKRDIQFGNLGGNWDGAAGVSETNAPIDWKMSGAAGGKIDLEDDIKIGGSLSAFYERDSSFFDDGQNDSWRVEQPGGPLVPETLQQTADNEFFTALFDVTQGSQQVQWGGLGTVGIESDNHALDLSYLYTRTTEDKATLAEDTRGKQYFFPGYDPTDLFGPGNTQLESTTAPYIRTETLEYTEREIESLQLQGSHVIAGDEDDEPDDDALFRFGEPEVSWAVSDNRARLYQPDKRQFGSYWLPEVFNTGGTLGPFTSPAGFFPFKPAANFQLGNFQRIWKDIEEKGTQYKVDVKFPFDQWDEETGYVKVGLFDDSVKRTFEQDSFSNFNDNGNFFQGGFNESWSASFPFEDHPITPSQFDVDYDGKADIDAYYGMFDLPVSESLSFIAGARVESTKLDVTLDPDPDAFWFPPGQDTPVDLDPGDADVDFEQTDVLPSLGLVYEATDQVTLRASYSETIARQTFKELTPVLQQEFLGGPIFIGNPELGMSALKNYDLRMDYVPYEGSLLSATWFKKDIDDPIENVQRVTSTLTFTTAQNYPTGTLWGWEFEARQDLGHFWEEVEGLSVGANVTFINSRVDLPFSEQAEFSKSSIQKPTASRDMTNAPEFLYNLYTTYEIARTETQLALFYTVKGDTLVAGATAADNFYVPDIYEKEVGTLNFSLRQRINDRWNIQFQAKNLTDPDIQQVYRSDYVDGDRVRNSYSRGREYSLSASYVF